MKAILIAAVWAAIALIAAGIAGAAEIGFADSGIGTQPDGELPVEIHAHSLPPLAEGTAVGHPGNDPAPNPFPVLVSLAIAAGAALTGAALLTPTNTPAPFHGGGGNKH